MERNHKYLYEHIIEICMMETEGARRATGVSIIQICDLKIIMSILSIVEMSILFTYYHYVRRYSYQNNIRKEYQEDDQYVY